MCQSPDGDTGIQLEEQLPSLLGGRLSGWKHSKLRTEWERREGARTSWFLSSLEPEARPSAAVAGLCSKLVGRGGGGEGKDLGITLGMTSGLVESVGNLGKGSPFSSAIDASLKPCRAHRCSVPVGLQIVYQ